MVTNRLSPGTSFFEEDFSLTATSAVTRNGAFCDIFSWGPAAQPILMESEDTLVSTFYKPNDDNFKGWFNAAEFLREANGLYVTRIVPSDATNAIIGGTGTGLTLDVSAVNGEVASIAINQAGTGYTAGDIVEISGGVTRAEVRILTVSVGVPVTIELLSNGTGYVTTDDVATINRDTFLVENDDEYDNATVELPEIIAKYPGALGNNIGLTVVRASEFYGNLFEDRFRKAPAATEEFFDGDGITVSFAVASSTIADTDKVVTVDDVTISEGTDPGTYSVVGSNIVITPEVENFSGDDLTATFTLANTYSLDLLSAVVVVDGVQLTASFDGTGHVAAGYFDIDPEAKELTIGTNLVTLSGDGTTAVWSITTEDTITASNVAVTVDGTAYTIVEVAPATGEVQLQSITGGYSFTFFSGEEPGIGLNNIEIEWGFPTTDTDNIVVTYGLPNGSDSLKVFSNQTEVHAIVFDATGSITGTQYSVIESYSNLSMSSSSVAEDGTSDYYVRRISDSSNYVRITKDLTFFTNHLLGNGSDGSTLTSSDYQNSYALFNSNDYDIMYIIDPVIDSSLTLYLLDLAETDRNGDCAVFTGAPRDLTVNNRNNELSDVLAYFGTLRSSSYGIFDPSWQYILDRYNSVYRWVPTTGVIAGLWAANHEDEAMWSSAMGLNRGQLSRAQRISWLPTLAQRDTLYPNKINFIIHKQNAGYYVWGQHTMYDKTSAFDQAHIRFLSIYVKRGIRDTIDYIIGEYNDEITRASVRNILNPFMRNIKSGRGVYRYEVVCDSSNNPDSVINEDELIVYVLMDPVRIVQKIGVYLVYTQTGLSFEEVDLTNTAT